MSKSEVEEGTGESGVRSAVEPRRGTPDGSDVLIWLSSAEATEDDPTWTAQLERFADDVHGWTGNPCSLVEYSPAEFDDLLASAERLAADLRADGIALTARSLPKSVVKDRM